MRVLIDTNIFIDRENYRVLPPNLQELLRIMNTLRIVILVHPRSIDEIRRDGNEDRKKVALSKIRTYKFLESPPDPGDDNYFTNIAGFPVNINDSVDNAMLYAVHRNAVDFLISEDRGIHNKALKLALNDRVLSSEEALTIFRKGLLREKVRHPPALKSEFVYNLTLEDPFFDSIKITYPEFEVWFKKICREGRKCWVYLRDDGSVGALLIYKLENEPINSIPPIPVRNRLKLCTFKVTYTGFKIGELLIRLSVEYCVRNNLTEMYLTHFTKEEGHFANLLNEYGFSKVARIDGEDVYLKKLLPEKERIKSLSPLDISKTYYPSFYDGPLVRKYIVPIRPEYHNRLFVDYIKRQTTIPEHTGEFIIEGNTITKAYLSHSKIRKISQGDLLLFYRSRDEKELTSIGVVESSRALRNKDTIIRLVGKRTVYGVAEIEEIVRKTTLVILFRLHFHFPKPLKLVRLRRMKILEKAPQTIVTIPHRKYLKIKREGELDERYTFH